MKLLVAAGADPNIPTVAPNVPVRRGPGGPPAGAGGPIAPTAEANQAKFNAMPVPAGGPGALAIHAAAGVEYGEGFAGNAHRHAPDAWMAVMKYLVEELHADVNARDNDGYTPLHHAAARGDNEMINYLVSKGADVTAVARSGQTTADMANGPVQRISPYPATVALLEKLGSKNSHKNGLLKQFEDGKMTRRQLIQSLSLAAVAAAPAGAALAQGSPSTIPAATAPPAFKTVWLDHISYAVTDYRKSTAFYRDLMGWEIRNDNGKNQCTMKIGDIGEIIIRNRREPEAGTAGAQTPPAPITGVINHVSYGIDKWNTEGVKAELEKRGLKPRPDMVGDNFKSFHVKDPDGWDLQISNVTKTTRE